VIHRLLTAVANRFDLPAAHSQSLRKTVPPWVGYSFCFGGIAFALFCTLLATGIILAFHYVPTEEGAYQSIVRLADEVWLGSFLRGAHAWSGDLIVLALLLHMGRVFVSGAFNDAFATSTYSGENEWIRYNEVSPGISAAFHRYTHPESSSPRQNAKIIQFPLGRRGS
jgi:quinol-cytochrome oxidoreductase complex cytochrome b subunit